MKRIIMMFMLMPLMALATPQITIVTNVTVDASCAHFNSGGQINLKVNGPGVLTFKARGSYDGFYYGLNREVVHGYGGHYVRNSETFQDYSFEITDEGSTVVTWAAYAQGYIVANAWGEVKDLCWNDVAVPLVPYVAPEITFVTNVTVDASCAHFNSGGQINLKVNGPGVLTFKARASYDGFYYGLNREVVHGYGGHYVRNSETFRDYSFEITDEGSTIVTWAAYAQGYIVANAWGEVQELCWNGELIPFPVTPTGNGLAAHYRFDGNANDSQGNWSTLTADSKIEYVTDRTGNDGSAISLDGNMCVFGESRHYVHSNFTFACWFRAEGTTKLINVTDDGIRGTSSEIRYLVGESVFPIAVGSNGINVFEHSDFYLPAIVKYEQDLGNSWHHLVMTVKDSGGPMIYLDGDLIASASRRTDKYIPFVGTGGYDQGSGQRNIGLGAFSYGGHFKGAVDEARYYTCALSAAEVAALYNEGGDPIVNRTVTFDGNGGVVSAGTRQVKNGAAVGELPTATRAGYDFVGWFTSANGGAMVSAGTVVSADVKYYAHWTAREYAIAYSDLRGASNPNPAKYTIENTITFAPLSDVDGYRFVGWSIGGIARGATGNLTVTALWEAVRPDIGGDDDDDEPMDASVANTYDGVIVDADGLPVGYVNVKAAKASGKGEAKTSKVTATIQMVGEEKKVTVKATVSVDEAAFTQKAADGRILDLSFSRYGIWGTFDGYEIDGVRNLLASTAKSDKGTETKAQAEAAFAALKGNYVMTYGDESGYNGLSITVMAKGKVKVSGKLSNGVSVSTTSQLIVGSDYSVIPVIYSKKGTSLAFDIYFSNDGLDAEVFGYYDAVISPVSNLRSGLSFYVGETIYDLFEDYELCDWFLPDGVFVDAGSSKWVVADGAKAGKIKVVDGDVIDTKESENPSGLKLTFKAKTGAFSGSFKVYALDDKGKLKTLTASVSGIVVDGYGYGVATIRGFGSCSVVIDE